MFICALLPLLNPGTYALLPHLFPTGSYSTSVNWVIKYFYIHAGVSWDSHINTVITGLTFCYEGQACCTDFSLPLKYFITSKWKIVPPIQTYLQVIQKGFPMQNLQYKKGSFVFIYLFFFRTVMLRLTYFCFSIILRNRDVTHHQKWMKSYCRCSESAHSDSIGQKVKM